MLIARHWSYAVVLLVLANCWLFGLAAAAPMECNSCGDECTISCGTRHFRTCCFNYMRKRSAPPRHPALDRSAAEPATHSLDAADKLLSSLTRSEMHQLKHLLKTMLFSSSSSRPNADGHISPVSSSKMPAGQQWDTTNRASPHDPDSECYQWDEKYYCLGELTGAAEPAAEVAALAGKWSDV